MRFSRLEVVDWAQLAEPGAGGHAQHVRELAGRGYSGLWLAEPARARSEVAPALSLLAGGYATASGESSGEFEIGLITQLRAFMHPLRIAEDIAMLDIASEGRVRWATSAGQGFDARALEQLEIIRDAVTGAPVSHDGAFYRFADVQCQPAPFSEPGPTLSIVTGRSDCARQAREIGFEVLWDRVEAISPGTAARSIAAVHVTNGSLPDALSEHPGVIAGDAAACRAHLAALAENEGVAHLVVRFDIGGLPAEEVAAAEERFLDDVLPSLGSLSLSQS